MTFGIIPKDKNKINVIHSTIRHVLCNTFIIVLAYRHEHKTPKRQNGKGHIMTEKATKMAKAIDNVNEEKVDYVSAAFNDLKSSADTKAALTFIQGLAKGHKKTREGWKAVGKVLVKIEDVCTPENGKPNMKRLGGYNKELFPTVDSATLSHAKTLYREWDAIVSYLDSEKMTGLNNPVTIVKSYRKWLKDSEAQMLKAKIAEMPEEQAKAELDRQERAKAAEKAAKQLKSLEAACSKIAEYIAEGRYDDETLANIETTLDIAYDAANKRRHDLKAAKAA